MPARKSASKAAASPDVAPATLESVPSTDLAPATPIAATPEPIIELEHDDMDCICKPQYSSKTINEFIPDYVGKIPSGAAFIEVFLFIDKTRIKTTDTYSMFQFCPARINIIDKQRKCLGFMSTTKLQSLYSDLKLVMFESNWSKLIRDVNINVINIELTPKIAKSGKQYYKTQIRSVPTTNVKVCESLMKLYDDTPTAVYERSTEKVDEVGFEDDVEEIL